LKYSKNGEHLSFLQFLKENTGKLHVGNLQLDMAIVQKCSETTFLYKKWDDKPEIPKHRGPPIPIAITSAKKFLKNRLFSKYRGQRIPKG
jgi:hypothetical protein